LITNCLLIYVASDKKFTLGVFTQPVATADLKTSKKDFQMLKVFLIY
jgi:hypothetical protein